MKLDKLTKPMRTVIMNKLDSEPTAVAKEERVRYFWSLCTGDSQSTNKTEKILALLKTFPLSSVLHGFLSNINTAA